MTGRACETFRREFEPGRRGPHAEGCPECRAWAEAVESWRALSCREALPGGLRARLLGIPALEARRETPLAPLPPALRTRLLNIPTSERSRRRVLKARYAVAASYLLAGLVTLATSGDGTARQEAAARGLAQASSRGTEALRDVNGWILAGCGRANETLEKLFGHLGRSPDVPGEPPPTQTPQEDPDGTRKAP